MFETELCIHIILLRADHKMSYEARIGSKIERTTEKLFPTVTVFGLLFHN